MRLDYGRYGLVHDVADDPNASYRLIDLFSGAGGMTLGFKSSGFVPICAVENDPDAARSYEANFGGHVLNMDLSVVDDDVFPKADVIIGGPPCQGFSQLGTRDPDDPRNRLWREFLRVVEVVRPRAFVMENVPRLLKSVQFEAFCDYVSQEIVGPEGERYEIVASELDASQFGVPQRRNRAFVVGSTCAVCLPSAGKNDDRFTVGKAKVFDLPEPSGYDLPGSPPYQGRALHLLRRSQEISIARYRSIPPGGNRFDLPEDLLPPCWKNKPTGTTDVMGRLRLDRPASTIRTEFYKPEKGRYLHPDQDRPITLLEGARIQSFPDTFQWYGSKTSIGRQIGNAVPPRLAAVVADHLKDVLDCDMVDAEAAIGSCDG